MPEKSYGETPLLTTYLSQKIVTPRWMMSMPLKQFNGLRFNPGIFMKTDLACTTL